MHDVGHYVHNVDDTVPGGANLMNEVVCATLPKLEEKGKLPHNNPTLNSQMDGCSENKNNVLFSFLSDLVSHKVFSEVFLLLGYANMKQSALICLH